QGHAEQGEGLGLGLERATHGHGRGCPDAPVHSARRRRAAPCRRRLLQQAAARSRVAASVASAKCLHRECGVIRLGGSMNIFTRSLAVVLMAGVALPGCNVFRGQSTAGQYVDDVSITARVKAKLLDSKE